MSSPTLLTIDPKLTEYEERVVTFVLEEGPE